MCLKHCQEVILGSCLFHSHGSRDDVDGDEDSHDTAPLNPPVPIVQVDHGPPLPSDTGFQDL
jgi:hypothetical protein